MDAKNLSTSPWRVVSSSITAWVHAHRRASGLLSGVLLGAGFWWPELWPLALVGGWWFLWLVCVSPGRSWIFIGWLVGSTKAAIALGWVWSVYPFTGIPHELGQWELVVIGWYWLSAAVVIGLSFVPLALLMRVLRRWAATYRQQLLGSVVVALGWVGAELAGAWLFSLFTLGPGSELNAAFSVGFTGYHLAQHPWLLPIAHGGGVYALSFVFGLLIVLPVIHGNHLVGLCRHLRWRVALIGGGALLVLSGYVVHAAPVWPSESARGVPVATINTAVPISLTREQSGWASNRVELENALEAALATPAAVVVYPEDARFLDQRLDLARLRGGFQQRFGSTSATIIDSGRVRTAAGTHQRAVVIPPTNPASDWPTVTKQYLVPHGEYLPYVHGFLLGRVAGASTTERLRQQLDYVPKAGTTQDTFSSSTPGILFCSESLDPQGVRRLVQERPELPFVVHPYSHAWFHTPRQLWHQLDTMLRVQAVWNDLHIVSAGNHGPSQVYHPSGAVTETPIATSSPAWEIGLVRIPLR